MAKEKFEEISTKPVSSFAQCKTMEYTDLCPAARQRYEKACRHLMKMKRLHTSDLPVLALYAQAQVDITTAQKLIDEDGMFLDEFDRNGNQAKKAHPAVKVKMDLQKFVRDTAIVLGFTETGRKRLKIEQEKKKPKDPLDEWMQ